MAWQPTPRVPPQACLWRLGRPGLPQELRSRLPEGAEQLYGAAMDKVARRTTSKKGGTPVEEVSRAVAHALASPRPKRRYLIGRDARMGALMARLLPASILDHLIISQRGLRKK